MCFLYGRYQWIIFCFFLLVTITFTFSQHIFAQEIAKIIVINEILADPPAGVDVNQDGKASTSQDEFVEIVNISGDDLDISGFQLVDASGGRFIFPENTMLFDRCAAVVFRGGTPVGLFGGSMVFTGMPTLNNTNGDTITLFDSQDNIIDQVSYSDRDGHADQSITRFPDLIGGMVYHQESTTSTAAYSPGIQVNGTLFSSTCQRPDLTVAIDAAASADAAYDMRVTITNIGSETALNVHVDMTTTVGVIALDNNDAISSTQVANRYQWTVGKVASDSSVTLDITLQPTPDFVGVSIVNLSASTTEIELSSGNNDAFHQTLIGDVVLINAIHHHGLENVDEAIQLINLSDDAIDLTGWKIGDEKVERTFNNSVIIPANDTIWIAKDTAAFTRQFGFAPDYDETILTKSFPSLGNDGDIVRLVDDNNHLVDAVAFGETNIAIAGWNGETVNTHMVGQSGSSGQILYRKLDQISGNPIPDTDTVDDWAQQLVDVHNGRKVRYPGWDIDQFFMTAQATEYAQIEIGIAPDNSFAMLKKYIDQAQQSIVVQMFHITSKPLVDALIAAVNRGVSVTILMESEHISDDTRELCRQLSMAIDIQSNEDNQQGCWWMISDADQDIYDRYKYMHAKYLIIDDETSIISSDNLTNSSFPADDKTDGTSGRRGTIIATDAAVVLQRLQAIWSVDFDPINHHDLVQYAEDHLVYGNKYGRPQTMPDLTRPNAITTTIQYPQSTTFEGIFSFEVIQSPENSLRTVDSLLGMLERAKLGDTIYVQQQYEYLWWGRSDGNPEDDPNLRLQAYINAARRGANVSIQLDHGEYMIAVNYNEMGDVINVANSNIDTCNYIKRLATKEALQLRCQTAIPVDKGIHNKMIIAQIDGDGYVHIGSINGSETASKANREVALQLQSDEAYDLLAAMFRSDWQYDIYLPTLLNNPEPRADHVLITEVMYRPRADLNNWGEYIEIANPTGRAVDMHGWKLSDAESRADYEDQRLFSNSQGNTILGRDAVWVIARRANAFIDEWGYAPDFEMVNTNNDVPDMLDDPRWGDNEITEIQLGNQSDQLFLRDPADNIIDVVVYGDTTYANQNGVAGVPSGFSLERFPWWQDTNQWVRDFRRIPQGTPNQVSE